MVINICVQTRVETLIFLHHKTRPVPGKRGGRQPLQGIPGLGKGGQTLLQIAKSLLFRQKNLQIHHQIRRE